MKKNRRKIKQKKFKNYVRDTKKKKQRRTNLKNNQKKKELNLNPVSRGWKISRKERCKIKKLWTDSRNKLTN